VYFALLVLNSEQEIVALSFYKIRRKLGKGQFEAENGIAVREDYQGRGLGFKLFILGNRFARLNRVRKVYSLVNCRNEKMINLNKKLGFKIDRKVAMKNLRTGEGYQALEMSLSMS
jgi:GNAT superfamily N-acetyltransferase